MIEIFIKRKNILLLFVESISTQYIQSGLYIIFIHIQFYVNPYIYLFIYLSIHLFIYPPIHLAIYSSSHLFIYSPIHLLSLPFSFYLFFFLILEYAGKISDSAFI